MAFHKFHAPLQEPWDGPALIVFSDGLTVGATLDRNGLRPARYTRLEDGTVYVMSETGVVPIEDEAQVAEKGRLGPGQMISIDLRTGLFSDDAVIKKGELTSPRCSQPQKALNAYKLSTPLPTTLTSFFSLSLFLSFFSLIAP